jgi:hypothetical protein
LPLRSCSGAPLTTATAESGLFFFMIFSDTDGGRGVGIGVGIRSRRRNLSTARQFREAAQKRLPRCGEQKAGTSTRVSTGGDAAETEDNLEHFC